jgi:hypothetical protein
MNTSLLIARSHSCRSQAPLIEEHLFLHEELRAQWVNRSSEPLKGYCQTVARIVINSVTLQREKREEERESVG